MKANLFVSGFPKCGTTYLASMLDQHPEIAISKPKEASYFSDFRDRPQVDMVSYDSMFQGGSDVRYYGDATPDYMYGAEALKKIRRAVKDPKLIVAVRNHVELLPSLHQQELFNGNESVKNVHEAWNKSEARAVGVDVPRLCREVRRLDYRSRLSMGKQLEQCIEIFGREAVFVLDFDSLIHDFDAVWCGLRDFLEVRPASYVESDHRNPRTRVRWPAVLKATRMLYELKRSAGISIDLGIGRQLRSISAPVAKHPTALSAALSLEVQAYFEDDWSLIARLALQGPSCVSGGLQDAA